MSVDTVAPTLAELEAHAQAAPDSVRRIARGIDPPLLAGLRNIRDRIESLGGSFKVASGPGLGTVLTMSLPWPAAADGPR